MARRIRSYSKLTPTEQKSIQFRIKSGELKIFPLNHITGKGVLIQEETEELLIVLDTYFVASPKHVEDDDDDDDDDGDTSEMDDDFSFGDDD